MAIVEESRGRRVIRRLRGVLFLAAVAVQIVAWVAVYYGLRYAIPFYRDIVRNLRIAPGSVTFDRLVLVSRWLALKSGDPEFGALLGVALFALAAFNLFTVRRMTSARRRRWCLLILLFVPLCLLALEIGCLAQVRHEILIQRPDWPEHPYRMLWFMI